MDSFTRAIEYRRQELLDFVGSRQGQSGVIWGPRHPNGLICTSGGRHGRKAGYADEQLSDGSWHYFGQGVSGSQSLNNAANARLATPSKTIFLFLCREPTTAEVAESNSYGKLYRFIGQFISAGYDYYIPKSGTRKQDRLLRFHLMPAESDTKNPFLSSNELPLQAADLRNWIIQEHLLLPKIGSCARTFWLRSLAISKYAHSRANGVCEACGNPAPFLRDDKSPFLEVHHITRLADAGPDIPENVAAICPNCHRRAHFGLDSEEFNVDLAKAVRKKERR